MAVSFSQKLRTLFSWTSAHIIARMPKFLRQMLSPVYQAALRLVRHKRLVQARKAILELIAAQQGGKTLIIFPPSLDWNVQLFQRPQQLALALARQGALVLYFQPKPDFSQPPFQEIHPNLILCNLFVQACDILESPTVYFLTWNCGYVDSFRSPRLIYDFVDDIKVFYADQELITRYHYQMLRDAGLVLVTAHKLLEEVQQYRDRMQCTAPMG